MSRKTDLTRQQNTIGIGQRQIQNDEIERALAERFGATPARPVPLDLDRLGLEPLDDETSDAGVVLDQQNSQFVPPPSLGSAMLIVKPRSARLLAAIVPPCCSTTQRATASPSPEPARPSVLAAPWK